MAVRCPCARLASSRDAMVAGMMRTTSSSASALVEAQALSQGAKPAYRVPDVQGPSHTEAFYATTAGGYSGAWNDATAAAMGHLGDCPTISEVLAMRGQRLKPIKPLVNTGISVLAKQVEEAREARLADKVLSADVLPKKFPAQASEFNYPTSAKRGANNPLYQTASQAIGQETPLDHQISDRYFPGANEFTKQFVDLRPRNTSLNTSSIPSRVHKNLDTKY